MGIESRDYPTITNQIWFHKSKIYNHLFTKLRFRSLHKRIEDASKHVQRYRITIFMFGHKNPKIMRTEKKQKRMQMQTTHIWDGCKNSGQKITQPDVLKNKPDQMRLSAFAESLQCELRELIPPKADGNKVKERH